MWLRFLEARETMQEREHGQALVAIKTEKETVSQE